MNADTLRGWLLQQPKPALIRVTTEGDIQDLKPGKSWAKTAETIVALEPELVQCFDASGNLTRATRFEVEPAPRRGSPAPDLPPVIAQDPHVALLHHFASLLHRAYEHSTQVAFDKMGDVCERINDRSENIEQRLERSEARARRLQEDQVEDAYDRAAELAAEAQNGGGDEALKSHLMQAFMSGQLTRNQPNGKPNGAPPVPKAKA